MYLVGIAGGSGSGKTTFSEKILKKLNGKGVALLHMDNYYLDKQPSKNFIDGQPNYDSPEAFDWKLFFKHLKALKAGQSVAMPHYNFSTSRREKRTIKVGPCRVVLVEGILSLWLEEVRNLMDLKIYLKVEADIRFTRRLHRDLSDRSRQVEDVISQYYKTVRPMHLKYTQPTQQFADIIVGEHHDVAVEVVSNHILSGSKARKRNT
ncbi:MAG: uridine kinase [Oligoflexia bacterium]|nr:uridine kinase [Oligoflexia bacterium]